MSKKETMIGVIGGSGVYDIKGLTNTKWKKINSSFGDPSDKLLFGELDGQKMVFLPRHGRGHTIPPSKINFRANIDALKRSGVTDIISVSAVGSLRDNLKPGMFVIIDQFVDRTFARKKSFFGTGLVAHVSMAQPVCSRLSDHVEQTTIKAKISSVRGGTYIAMEGPQFSSVAESELYRSWGCDVVGMTNMPEAKLAREAELCYVSIAMVTDYDCWHPNHENVTVDSMVQVLLNNADNARLLVKEVAPNIGKDLFGLECDCKKSLDSAIITQPDYRDSKLVKKLDAVAGRVLNSE